MSATRSTSPLSKLGASALAVIGLAAAAYFGLGEVTAPDAPDAASSAESTSTGVPEEVEDDYFTITGTAQREHNPGKGEVDYCDLDELDRAVCAYGLLTYDTRMDAQRRGRQDISVDPTGWEGNNAETDIPALSDVKGSKAYHGWMYNRSHLLADSIGGNPEKVNLVTGTRTQNVGSSAESGEYAGGMAHTEVIARDYLDSKTANDCPLYYAATPNYSGDELLPRTVTVDIQSCDKSIDERVEVSNTAAGHTIDYATGQWSAAD